MLPIFYGYNKMNTNDRHTIIVELGYIEIENCSIDKMIEVLQKYRSEYDGYMSLVPEGGYSGFDGYKILLSRDETDEEIIARHAAEKKRKEDTERTEMNRLMQKKSLNAAQKETLIKYIQEYM